MFVRAEVERQQPFDNVPIGRVRLFRDVRIGPLLRASWRLRHQQPSQQAVVSQLRVRCDARHHLRLNPTRHRNTGSRNVPALVIRFPIDGDRPGPMNRQPAFDIGTATAAILIEAAEPSGQLVTAQRQASRLLLQQRASVSTVRSSTKYRLAIGSVSGSGIASPRCRPLRFHS